MRSKMLPFAVLAAVLMVFLTASSCSNGSSVCPTCGTTSNGSIVQIDTMLVPEHNGFGEPGGPFNIFDIGWVDSVNHLYYISDRVGLDVPIFDTVRDVAVFDLAGDNSIADSGVNPSPCFKDPETGVTIPPISNAVGNFTRFGCKTLNFRLPGFFGPDGNVGGWVGGQCCASRSNNLNPITGPNGLEASADGMTVFVGNGSSNAEVFDMSNTIADIKAGVLFPRAPTVIATLVSGNSPDYDGPNGIGPCQASANGRAFSDPTCGDLRGDELATTGATPAMDPQGNPHDLMMMINGDPALPYVTLFDVTHVMRKTGTLEQQHCLPVNNQQPYSPGGPNAAFPRNFATCVLGQIYYDNALPTDSTVTVDENNGFSCPDPSLQFIGTIGVPGPNVPTGASGTGVGSATHLAGVNVPCHHGPMLRNGPQGTPTNGIFCPTSTSFPDCFGAFAFAGLGGMAYNPNTGHFLLSNGSATTDLTVGTIDEIDPGLGTTHGPIVINSFLVPQCMPAGVSIGPGNDVLVACAGHDGRSFAPTTYIIDGRNGTILQKLNQVGGVDESWYNPGDNRYYLGARDNLPSAVLGVIDAGTRHWLQNVTTQGNTHSVAVDSGLNKIFVPLPSGPRCGTIQIDGCVGVY
ncbi:MAG: hypothetical protein WB780_12645, partial [Candidatus Acidiferrales bacterium]